MGSVHHTQTQPTFITLKDGEIQYMVHQITRKVEQLPDPDSQGFYHLHLILDDLNMIYESQLESTPTTSHIRSQLPKLIENLREADQI